MERDNAQLIILVSERLIFRQHIMADMDAYCDMEQDPDVRKFVGGYARSREDAESRFLNGAFQPVNDRLAMWATILKSENKYIGRCGLYPHFNVDGNPIKDEATLAFYIARGYWGRGFATEAGQAFIRFGFDVLKVKRIVATIQVGNDPSVHVIKKLGFMLCHTESGPRSFYHLELKENI
ncbi:GNAT family N-acetyltransferase [Mucilaginibacter sp. X5P1]|uniref:GNAT family N-acetyltransferase n=1 Tax=Mucilaginibacter sp. X5P1 TaxID=2723088 RepID=UPI00161D8709|nr:RimJ/RimL family protein N-acetyltransferase [Mucilaginibacter sp. X5P1]